jgi:hypothetical protein
MSTERRKWLEAAHKSLKDTEQELDLIASGLHNWEMIYGPFPSAGYTATLKAQAKRLKREISECIARGH